MRVAPPFVQHPFEVECRHRKQQVHRVAKHAFVKVAAKAVVGFEVSDDGFDRGAAAQILAQPFFPAAALFAAVAGVGYLYQRGADLLFAFVAEAEGPHPSAVAVLAVIPVRRWDCASAGARVFLLFFSCARTRV